MAGTLSPLFSWRSAICDSDLPPTARHVALTLSLHMNERGESCFPAAKKLAADTGLSERTVREALKTLGETGWLRKTSRYRDNGSQTSNDYQATVPTTPPAAAAPPPSGDGIPPRGTRGIPPRGYARDTPTGVRETAPPESDSNERNPPTPQAVPQPESPEPKSGGREDQIITAAIDLRVHQADREGGVTHPVAFRRSVAAALDTPGSRAKITRWAADHPTAPDDVLAACLLGSTSSLRYYPRVDDAALYAVQDAAAGEPDTDRHGSPPGLRLVSTGREPDREVGHGG